MKTDLLNPWYAEAKQDAVKVESERRRLFQDVADTFGTPAGRRVLVHILGHANTFQSAMTGNSFTYYEVAKQDFGRSLLELVAAADMETYLHVFKQQGEKIQKQYEPKETDK